VDSEAGYAEIARRIAADVRAATRPVILIDGRSGSGKTTLALHVQRAIPGAQLVRLDDFYPGWDGLDAGSIQVAESVLSSARPRWRRWDWAADAPAEWVEVDPIAPLVVEGIGALSRASAPAASLRIWVDADADLRRERALARDGDTYRPHWERWARQEERFIARERPDLLADLRIDTTEGPRVDEG
jgi:uridine kinase